MKTAFIGHRKIFDKRIEEKILKAIKTEIDNGCREFTMGTHGRFDTLALCACRILQRTYTDLKIEVVITSLNTIKKENEFDDAPYSDVDTVMYDIEEEHFKRKISASNRQMIDQCDTLICYVDTKTYYSGAKKALAYAKRRGLKIINLYRTEDLPFYGLTYEEADRLLQEQFERIKNK